MQARAPASSANLGPGFDALALAVDLYVEVAVEPAGSLSITSTGEGGDVAADPSHLAARVATAILGHDRVAISVNSEVPLGRGLGSSAALVVATAAAAGAEDPLAWGARFDGHPENAAASAIGGLVAASLVDGHPVARRLPLDPELALVALVPQRSLATASARTALPAMVTHEDAAFNLSRLGLLVAGLADLGALVAAAGDDHLHQRPRSVLFPEAPALLDGLRAAGALTSCWSGAGPTLLGLCRVQEAGALVEAARTLLDRHRVSGVVRVLRPDTTGVVVGDRPAPPERPSRVNGPCPP